jgi:hypothetical protein
MRMKLGIKVAPRQDSFEDITNTKAEFTEVWYNANKPDDYRDLFNFLHDHAPHSSLHFWGAIDNGTLATISYPDTKVIKETLALIKKTIDTAAKNNFSYVNIHPGTRSLVHMDFTTTAFTVLSKPQPVSVCEPIFFENAKDLSNYAANRGVLLTIESVPPEIANRKVRGDTLHVGELPLQTLLHAVDMGIAFANDFCHTAANCSSQDTKDIWTMLYDVSKQYASQTKLIHIGFLIPPFNGTDFHDHMDNPLLQTHQSVPNNNQLIELFKLFPNRTDVYALVEPTNDHVKNYFLAKDLLMKAGLI